MKKAIILCLFAVIALAANAVPAKRGVTRNVVLENGETITLTLSGDEFGHYWVAENGERYLVDVNDKAQLLDGAARKALDKRYAAKRVARNAKRQARLLTSGQNRSAFTGEKRGLVILVEFNDLSMKSSSTQEEFDNMFNQEGYSNNNHIGSVHDYFYDQSYGQFDLTFDVVGPVRMPKNYSYYGRNDSNGDDQHPAEMVIEACNAVDELVDFADYDWDGDGEVEQVFVIYAGYGENAGASANTIWPHEYDLSSAAYFGDGSGPVLLDEVTIDTYAVSCELAGKYGSTMNGIGTACHEFAHCLGYPDFYDIDYSGGLGMQSWDLLDSGSYNGPYGNGEIPAGFSAYERWVAGWLTPVEVVPGMEVEGMKPIGDEPEAYVVYNDGNVNEYYLLENRKAERWFSYLSANKMTKSGMLITHVDYNKRIWDNNQVNDTKSHQRMSVIPANNLSYSAYSLSQYSGMLYPYNGNNALTNESAPAATLFNKNSDGTKFMNKPITDITIHADKTMSFVCEEIEEDPIVDPDPDGPGSGDGNIIFYESFDNCSGTGGNDGKWSGNIASSNFVPDVEGWNCSASYGANKCARFGTGKMAGTAESPEFVVDGDAILSFKAAAWGNDGRSLDVQVNGNTVQQITMNAESWSEVTMALGETGVCRVKFVASKRFFLDEVKVEESVETGMFMPSAMVKTNEVYNIYGQRVDSVNASMKKGIYIVNGRKVLVK